MLAAFVNVGGARINLRELDLDVPRVFSSTAISQGQFSVTVTSITSLVRGIGVLADEIAGQLDQTGVNRILAATSVLYLEAMNGLVKVIAGRQSAGRASSAVSPCLPLELKDTSVSDIIALVTNHKTQLRAVFGEHFLQLISDQHKALVRTCAEEPQLMQQLTAKTRKVFSQAWSPCGSCFTELQKFAVGLATVMPTPAASKATSL